MAHINIHIYIYQIRPYTAIRSFPTISPVMVSEFTSPYVYGLLRVVLVNRAVLLFPCAKILVGQIFLQLKNELLYGRFPHVLKEPVLVAIVVPGQC